MITFLRKKLHTKTYKIIIWVVFASMTLFVGLPSLLKRSSYGNWLVRVNGDVIEEREFGRRVQAKQIQLDLLRYQFEQMGIPFNMGMLNINPQQWALNSLIEDSLLNRIAQRMHIILDEEYIAYKLTDPYFVTQELVEFIPPQAMMGQGLNVEMLNRSLRQQGLNIATFEQFVEQALERKLVKDIIASSGYVPRFAIKDKYIQNDVAKKFSVLILSMHDAIKHEEAKPLDDKEVATYFEQHKKQYMVPEKRAIAIWEFTPEHYHLTVTDDEISSYYAAHKPNYQEKPASIKARHMLFKATDPMSAVQAKAMADKIYQEVVAEPHTFAHKKTDAEHKEIVIVKGDNKNPALEKAAFALKADGDISPILQTSQGFEIIQRVERHAPVYKKLHEVQHAIKTQLMNQKFKAKFSVDMDRLESSDKASALDDLVKDKHGKKTVKHVALDQDPIHQKAFKIRSVNGLAHHRDQDKGYVIQLESIAAAHVPALDALRTKVRHDIYAERAQKAMKDSLEQIKKMGVTDLADIERTHHGRIKHLDWIKADDSKAIERLADEGLPVYQMLQIENIGSIVTYQGAEDGYVMRLDDRGSFDNKAFEAKKADVARELSRQNSIMALNGFIASLNRNATIEINQKAFGETDN